jgi:hypothetical protein
MDADVIARTSAQRASDVVDDEIGAGHRVANRIERRRTLPRIVSGRLRREILSRDSLDKRRRIKEADQVHWDPRFLSGSIAAAWRIATDLCRKTDPRNRIVAWLAALAPLS